MPTLQSFSLPRSGPRVTARPCPPVVLRQRRRDFEALFRSEIRHSRGSWPNRTARCSPGLPLLEPHTGTRAKTGRSGGRFRDASATNARRLATPCARGRKKGTTSLSRPISRHQDRLRHHRSGVLAGLSPWEDGRPPESDPRRPASPSNTRLRNSPKASAPRHIRGVLDFLAGGVDRRSDRPPSARPRSVRSAAAVEGVHVADGLIGSRSVTRGRAIGAKAPASARRRKVPPNVTPGIRPIAPVRITARRESSRRQG